MSQPARPGQPNPHVERSGTLIETDEEVRQAISGLKGQGQPGEPAHCYNPSRHADAQQRALGDPFSTHGPPAGRRADRV